MIYINKTGCASGAVTAESLNDSKGKNSALARL